MKAASSDGSAPAGGLPATGGVPARDTDTAYGDRAVLARGQAGSGVLR